MYLWMIPREMALAILVSTPPPPFGAVEDPISELHLRATWSSVAEETVVDNDAYL